LSYQQAVADSDAEDPAAHRDRETRPVALLQPPSSVAPVAPAQITSH
jgi:hypothetical protein